jgi:hypothetical protein
MNTDLPDAEPPGREPSVLRSWPPRGLIFGQPLGQFLSLKFRSVILGWQLLYDLEWPLASSLPPRGRGRRAWTVLKVGPRPFDRV